MSICGRRALFQGSIGLASAVAVGVSTSGSVNARVPAAGTQAPGIYRFRVGSFEVTAMTSGIIKLGIDVIWPKVPREEVEAVLSNDFQPTNPPVTQVNVFAINTGDRLVLVDLGSGGKFFETAGALPTSLAAAGIHAEDVDTVVFTHAHPDHLFGATDMSNTRLLYPNAEYVISDPEWNFWIAPEREADRPTARWKDLVRMAQANLYGVEPRLRRIRPGAEIIAGITSIDTAGHTPGHLSLHVGSDGDELLCSSDVINNRAVSFAKPDWPLGFDMDVDKGARVRLSFLDRCATEKVLIASYHMPFPGIGHVARDGTAFRWVPIDWSWSL